MQSLLEKLRSYLQSAWDWAAARCASLGRPALAWGGIVLAAVILLSVNLVSSISLRNWQADLTEGQVFTISKGTREVLTNIDEPINVRVYFSKRLGEAAPNQARYFERVRTLIDSYRDISGGKLQVTYLDPEPFSDAEDRAVAAGLRGVRLNAEGETGYFGLVATNSTDNQELIPFFSADRGAFLEYDVTKLIHSLANPKKNVVGVISGLPINGGVLPMNNETTPPWLIMDQLREFFDVRMLDQTLTAIPSDIDVLLIAQPYELTPKAAYAIDQYMLGGGKALVLVDALPEAAQLATLGKKQDGIAEIKKILKSWGLEVIDDKVAGDIAHARRVQFGREGGPVTEYVSWLALDQRNIDQGDVLSAGIELLNLASAGYLKKFDDAGTTVTPLLHTSPQAMEIDVKNVGLGADPIALLRTYKPRGTALVLAARVTGVARSAFPDGAPKDAPASAESSNAKAGHAAAKDGKSAEPASGKEGSAQGPHLASGKVNAIVIADTDLMADQFWVDRRELLGQSVVMPTAHNAALIVGALENLSGNDALIALRGRGVTDRPFLWVESLRREAEKRFREKEEALTQRLQELQTQLAQIETSSTGNVILTDKERKAAEDFRAEMLKTRRELRDVKLALRQDIDRLDGWLKFANIALIPLAIGFGGLGWTLWRGRKRRSERR
jgi:ABC-type uncharacterized transport system involved in gliding motility auxiliary subunit